MIALNIIAVLALRVGKIGSRLGPQGLEGPQMPKVGHHAHRWFDTCSIVMNIGGAPLQHAGQTNRHKSLTFY